MSYVPVTEYNCTPSQLVRHIELVHLEPLQVKQLGIAKYDIDVARFRGFDMNPLADLIYSKMEGDRTLIWMDKMFQHGLHRSMTVDDYMVGLGKNLLYMEEQGVATVDWDRAKRALPPQTDLTLRTSDFLDSITFTPKNL